VIVKSGNPNLTPFSSPSPPAERGPGGEVESKKIRYFHLPFVKGDKRDSKYSSPSRGEARAALSEANI
jgi:hypothetical protein